MIDREQIDNWQDDHLECRCAAENARLRAVLRRITDTRGTAAEIARAALRQERADRPASPVPGVYTEGQGD